ncbi:MAG: multidrug effflux MFS transporter [Desulfuromonas thiophila]|jgi:DHA1 family bicyclomycin/chloramphenicol resistance-like MFS transporter|nr:multidrug effflux MFS transporter [Desulfuromonas thiophila]
MKTSSAALLWSPTFFLLVLLAAFPPLATDMYLPAIPLLQQQWQQPLRVVNLTLVAFFVSYCLFLLIYGPLSDRFGRRRPLLGGIALFILASIGCALSNSVGQLIVARIVQAAGAAAAAALSLAITKDIYRDSERIRMLAWMGVLMALAPAVSPFIGSLVLLYASWRWIFLVQAAIALLAWLGVLRMGETLQQPIQTGALETARIYLHLLRNRRYLVYALMVSTVVLPHFAYIAGSADIYINRLGLGEQAFSAYFAINALAFMSGSLLCTWLLPRHGAQRLLTLGFCGLLLGGLVLWLRPFSGPAGVAASMAIVTLSMGLSRPPSNNLVLKQVDRYAGAASSLLIFIFFIFGAFAMWLISLDWPDKVAVIGQLATAAGSLTLGLWLWLKRQDD